MFLFAPSRSGAGTCPLAHVSRGCQTPRDKSQSSGPPSPPSWWGPQPGTCVQGFKNYLKAPRGLADQRGAVRSGTPGCLCRGPTNCHVDKWWSLPARAALLESARKHHTPRSPVRRCGHRVCFNTSRNPPLRPESVVSQQRHRGRGSKRVWR